MTLKSVRTTSSGIDYIRGLLREGPRAVTRAIFWKIPHSSGKEDISLKIGKYNRGEFDDETLECGSPKSELTLEHEEFTKLITFISENHAPLKDGAKKYITVDKDYDADLAGELSAIFSHSNQAQVIEFLKQFQVMPDYIVRGLQFQQRMKAVEEFAEKLDGDLLEYDWQEWFTKNDWVLGSEYVRILDERAIDTLHIADYLMEAYDGFLDIVEIKRPEGGLSFWSPTEDHGNIVAHQDLVKAITQATNYIYEIEREMNSAKFLERVGHVPVVKPRIVLIFGRSNDWTHQQRKAYRILNTSYHCLSILTYDHVLARARRIVGLDKVAVDSQPAATPDISVSRMETNS